MTLLLTDPTPPGPARLLLAHGAGAPMDSPFLEAVAAGLGAAGVGVVRFEFAYMAQRREGGSTSPPPAMPRLTQAYLDVIRSLERPAGQRLYIGGKSMGGRVASLIAGDLYDQGVIAGLVCLGYPFHPPRKPGHLRTAHLAQLRCPTLIVQGTRDALGSFKDVAGYDLSPAIALHWLADGDHDFKPRRASGLTQDDHMASAVRAITAFTRGSNTGERIE